MNKADPIADKQVPWSFPVAVSQIPETGLRKAIESSVAQRSQIAIAAGLRDLPEAHASFELMHMREDQIHVVGRVTARVGQTCVVTLEPVENMIDEVIDIIFIFAPSSQTTASQTMTKPKPGTEDEDFEPPVPLEPIINGLIDLGKLATEFLILGIDPYPRKPDAVFVAPTVPHDPEDHPFAALKALKGEQNPAKGKKRKR